jgi:hypothetical protein
MVDGVLHSSALCHGTETGRLRASAKGIEPCFSLKIMSSCMSRDRFRRLRKQLYRLLILALHALWRPHMKVRIQPS